MTTHQMMRPTPLATQRFLTPGVWVLLLLFLNESAMRLAVVCREILLFRVILGLNTEWAFLIRI